jgi:hypothetical protein
MRTLVDLLDGEHGYVRIYAEREGFGYQLSTYSRRPFADLFEQMSGYASMSEACEAARCQLSSIQQPRRTGKRTRLAPARRRSAQSQLTHAE